MTSGILAATGGRDFIHFVSASVMGRGFKELDSVSDGAYRTAGLVIRVLCCPTAAVVQLFGSVGVSPTSQGLKNNILAM